MKFCLAFALVVVIQIMSLPVARAQSQEYNFTTLAGAGSAGFGSTDGSNSDARFWEPTGVAVDRDGNLYVADRFNYTVRKLTPVGTNWISSTIAGQPGIQGSTDGTNNASRFWDPFGVAVDVAGNVYVADKGNYTIRKLTAVGTNWVCSTIAGLAKSGGTSDGTNNGMRFDHPSCVTLDSSGNVYVADSGNNALRKLTLIGTNWVSTTIAGSLGSADGTNNAIQFHEPYGIATDLAGNIYVADSYNCTIRKLTPVGTNWVSSTIAGLAASWGSSDGTNSAARFFFPYGVAVDGDTNLYVMDSLNCTVRKLVFVGTNWVTSTIGGTAGSQGHADGSGKNALFYNPYGIAVNAAGDLYVADSSNNMIREGKALTAAPIFQTVRCVNHLITVTWGARRGEVYQLQYASDLGSTNWVDQGDSITGTNEIMSATWSIGFESQRFYRLLVLP